MPPSLVCCRWAVEPLTVNTVRLRLTSWLPKGSKHPNIHFLTVDDFEILAARQNWQIERRYFLSGTREVKTLPNLLAEVAVFVVSER